ncbi:MAG: Rab family GTPase [Candidatus Heimdallarchaeota archaeon]
MKEKSKPALKGKKAIFIIGDTAVGKTALVSSITNKPFDEKMTIGLNIESFDLQVKDEIRECSFVDLGGAEAFHKLKNDYVKECSGGIFVFDLTDTKSFENIPYYLNLIKDAIFGKPVVLVGNKKDKDRIISLDDATHFAEEHNMQYFETSVVTQENVEKVFSKICELVKIIIFDEE